MLAPRRLRGYRVAAYFTKTDRCGHPIESSGQRGGRIQVDAVGAIRGRVYTAGRSVRESRLRHRGAVGHHKRGHASGDGNTHETWQPLVAAIDKIGGSPAQTIVAVQIRELRQPVWRSSMRTIHRLFSRPACFAGRTGGRQP